MTGGTLLVCATLVRIETQIFGATEVLASARGVNRSSSLHAVIIPLALIAKVIPAVF